jgi:hypothetical protein
MTQRSFTITPEGHVTFYIHGQRLDQEHEVYGLKENIDLQSVDSAVCSVKTVVSKLRLFDVCCGVTALKYKKMWKSAANSVVDRNLFEEIRYNETCRSSKCGLVVTQSRRMCGQCVQLSKNFSQRLKAGTTSESSGSKQTPTPNKFKPYKYLVTPEKRARDRRKSKAIEKIKKENARLRAKLDALIQEEGVDIDGETEADLKIILNGAKPNPNTPFLQKLFMEQQLEACAQKDRRTMRWHPLLIRLALRIKMISSAAYNELSESGFVQLPSERTLYDYSHVIEVQDGVCRPIINEIAEQVNSFEHDYQRFHVLMFDEVYISEKLVQKKNTGEVVGYCKLTEVQQEFEELQQIVKSAAEQVPVEKQRTPPVAKRILSYLVKGTASSVQSVVASFAVASLTKEDLMQYTWEVIESLEAKDIRVVALTCDGSGVNRGFFEMHPPPDEQDDGDNSDLKQLEEILGPSTVTFCTTNIYAPDRLIYFFSDLPHLVKTARNCLYNSGKKNCRQMLKSGETLTWAPIIKLFNEKKEQTLKKLHKLTAACVYLNSYTRMKCLYAFRVLSGSVSKLILSKKWPGTTQLGIFGPI